MTQIVFLPNRAVLSVSGADRIRYLQGLVSNDVTLATPERAVWSALLTPQGKYLADFFIIAAADHVLLDVQRDQIPLLRERLLRFRLRAQVEITETMLHVYAAWPTAPDAAGIILRDPRLPEAGFRVLTETPITPTADFSAWDGHRLSLGLPDGTRDLEPEKTVLMEAGFDELGGISWTKGCYMGQELTARTRYRGLVKRRLVPVQAAALPPPGTPILADGAEAGVMRSSLEGRGLAVLRLDALAAPLQDGALRAVIPGWMRLAPRDPTDRVGK